MTTKLEIRDWHSADVDGIRHWKPESRADVYVQLELEIGNAGEAGADLFQVMIATPEGLRAFADRRGTVIDDRAIIILSDFSWPVVERHLTEIVNSCNAMTWEEATERLQRYFLWEYEDHKPG